MFENAIQTIDQFIRPLFAIKRNFESDVVKQVPATIFFVNEFGCALTSAEIALKFFPPQPYIEKYNDFKKKRLLPSCETEKLKSTYGYDKIDAIIDLKTIFINCGNNISRVNTVIHPNYNIALLHFDGKPEYTYTNYARFQVVDNFKKGKEFMRLGFPFPLSSNYIYNNATDEIEWDMTLPFIIDSFPLKGIVTRQFYDNNMVVGVEIDTPGYKGHEGSPLFDEKGYIYGIHCLNASFESNEGSINPKPIFGSCISAKIITQFLLDLGVKFYQIENGKEIIYNEKGDKPILPKQLLPTVYLAGDNESSIHVKEVKMEIGGQIVVDYKEPFQVAIGKTDQDSKKDGVALVQFSVDGQNEVFITEENAGNVSHLQKDNYYKLNVIKKEVSSPKWKIKASVKTQSYFPFYYFDILFIRRNVERDHKKDPHLTFFPDASGKYIRYDNERAIKISTKKAIKGKNSAILPLNSRVDADEFELDITYTIDEDILTISNLSLIEK
jgi:hypothetical protein